MKDLEEVWNIDEHKGVHESDEHWNLRRKFMERIQYQYPKMRVLSLSQVFANMEILGCRYPAATMELVTRLAEGISDEYRLSQGNFAQRTFMSASTAAEKRVKDSFPSSPATATNTPRLLSRSQDSKYKTSTASYFVPATKSPEKSNSVNSGKGNTSTTNIGASHNQFEILNSQLSNLKLNETKKQVPNSSTGLPVKTPTAQSKVKVKSKPEAAGPAGGISNNASTTDLTVNGFTEDVLKECRELVLVEELYKAKCTAAQILPKSCTKSKRKFLVEYVLDNEAEVGSGIRCKWMLGKHCIAEGIGATREGAKHDSYCKALEKLRQVCHTIQIKEKIVGLKQVTKDDLVAGLEEPIDESLEESLAALSVTQSRTRPRPSKQSPAPEPLSDSNVGNKLLRLMGWTGGALGKNEDGITEAIQVSGSAGHKRLGFGLVEKVEPLPSPPGQYTQSAIKRFLNTQLNGPSRTLDIVFATEFSAPERQAIHIAAQSIGLKSRSYGAKQKRQLVVSRDISLHDLVDELLCIGDTAKYRLIKPVNQGT